jgi:D,D-heptose 1,7-bisphosphate phosphatase
MENEISKINLNEPSIISIIPARGGSKGLPCKNIKLLAGKPLIYYAIYPSLNSKLIQHTFVSTDDDEIAKVALQFGAEVIMRPKHLAQDSTPDLPVLQHAIHYIETVKKIKPDLIVFLRPTQPLRNVNDINMTVKKAIETKAESVHTVHEVKEHPYWMNTLKKDDTLNDFIKDGWSYNRRQDLPKIYKSNGLVDVMTRDLIMIKGKKRGENQKGVITETFKGVDIDTEFDFFIAEEMYNKYNSLSTKQCNKFDKAIFIDRDGVINYDFGYVHKIDEFKFIPDVLISLKKACKAGYKLFIITNQAGIAKNIYNEEQYHTLTSWILKEMSVNGVKITKIYYCPHHPQGIVNTYKKICQCRKPNPGMLLTAANEYHINLVESFMIGDKTCDILAGKNAGCKTILVETGYAGKDKDYDIKPDNIAKNLPKAIEFILNKDFT